MKKFGLLILIISITAIIIPSVSSEGISIENMPPVVTSTSPVAGSRDVDPNLQKITVTFSKEMKTNKMWSWVMVHKNVFPQTTGDPYYMADGKTCVLPVKLESNKTYAIWINTPKFNNFRDKSNKPAVPYLLVFKTK